MTAAAPLSDHRSIPPTLAPCLGGVLEEGTRRPARRATDLVPACHGGQSLTVESGVDQ